MSDPVIFHDRAVKVENDLVWFSRKGHYDDFDVDEAPEGAKALWPNFNATSVTLLPDGQLLISGSGRIEDTEDVVVTARGDMVLNADFFDPDARLTEVD